VPLKQPNKSGNVVQPLYIFSSYNQCPKDPACHFGWLPQIMLPNTQNSPASFKKCTVYQAIAGLIPSEFFTPEVSVTARKALVFVTTVPEAAINKYGQACLRKNKVRVTEYYNVTSPACDVMVPEYPDETEFGGGIAPPLDPRHDVRPLLFRKHIGHKCYRFRALSFL
jgi:hypothetical protein